jgi:hypothetical protein
MHAFVTSYSGTSLVVNVDTVEGSGGPFTAWTINVGGLLTAQGALLEVNNLSDVSNPATALTNIGGVPTSRSISAGTGLTGGGDLTANRTLTVSYGSSAGTACEGNDARLSDARTPSSTLAHAASHAAAGSDPLAPSDIGLGAGDIVTFAEILVGSTGDGVTVSQGGFAHAPSGFYMDGSIGEIALPDVASGNDHVGVFSAANALSGNRTYTLPDASGTLALQGAITTSGLTQATARILGRTSASTGSIEEIQIGSGLSLSAGELSATGGDTVSIEASAADILSVASGAISADDAGADRIVYWNNTSNKLAYGTPADAGAAAASHSHAASDVTSGTFDNARINFAAPAAIGGTTAAAGTFTNVTANNGNFFHSGSGAIRVGANGTIGSQSIAIITVNEGATFSATGNNAIAIGMAQCRASGGNSIAIGSYAGYNGTGADSVSLGPLSLASAANSIAIGNSVIANLRSQVATRPFNAIYWSGQTTNATATILNLDGTATNRFTIAASTALAVDILLVARRTGTQDKWLVARRFLGIRRDGSNNTSLIGSVQTLGTDQSDGSPSWTFALTADDTNEALQLEVTGAASETVEWRATAFYRVA